MKYLFLIILIAGCVSQYNLGEFTYTTDDGYKIFNEDITYQFAYDIRETVKIPSNNEEKIREYLDTKYITVVQGGISEHYGYYDVIDYNVIIKLGSYLDIHQKRFTILNYSEFTETSEKVIFLRGPEIADKTSVDFDEETGFVFVNGKTDDDLIKASEKLFLIVFNIDEESFNDRKT